MKIGIVTLSLGFNYGGLLQAFALSYVLKQMGHQPTILATPRRYKDDVTLRRQITRFIRKCFGKQVSPLYFEELYKRESLINQHTWLFADKYIPRREILSFSEIRKNDYDAFVVGSDQVWRPKYFKPDYETTIENAYLNFAKGWNVKRIAYAASLGTDVWEYSVEETSNCKTLIKLFDAVSVREHSAVNILKEKLDANAQWVVDPTMLLTKDEYVDIFHLNDVAPSKGELMTYILDETIETEQVVSKLVKQTGYLPFRSNGYAEDLTRTAEERIQKPVEVWLRGFMDAKLVVTDSFHACVFSIVFGIPFYIVPNEERGIARIKSLLKMFNLTEDSIHYVDNSLLENVRRLGYNYLQNNLKQ